MVAQIELNDGTIVQGIAVLTDDGENAFPTGGGGGGGGSTKDTITTVYVALEGFFQVSAGDVLTKTEIIDNSTDPVTFLSATWRNQTTNTTLGSQPYHTQIQIVGGGSGGGGGIAETVWRENYTGLYYIRRDDGTNVTWTNLYGDPASTPDVTRITPAATPAPTAYNLILDDVQNINSGVVAVRGQLARYSIEFRNTGIVNAYIGGASLTADGLTGRLLEPGKSVIYIGQVASAAFYAHAAGDCTLAIQEIR